MSRVVRSSKYRHVFGTAVKKEEAYHDIRLTRTAWDSNYAAANPLFAAVLWDSGGGGSFAVIPWEQKGKIPTSQPVVAGHTSPVLDIDWNPFNDHIIASVSEDCYGKIWQIPQGGLTGSHMTDPVQSLKGHKRKVGCVRWHPTANNVIATASTDYSVKVWDVEKGAAICSIDAKHADIIQSIDWNFNGSLLASSCKDKKVRVLDPRKNEVSGEADSHQGVKGSRVVWLGQHEKLFSVGFGKTSEREYAFWDPRDLSKPLTKVNIDSASGVLMPFFDADTSVLFLAGRGDGNIRYYEVVDEAPHMHFLSTYSSNIPQNGLAFLPKRALNVSENEIMRALKITTKYMEPISFKVPRKSDIFQDDLYPDAFCGEPSMTADEWIGGKDENPKTINLEGGFVQKEAPAFNPVEQKEEKKLSEKELIDANEKLEKRVAYLEAEMIKRDAKIKELSG